MKPRHREDMLEALLAEYFGVEVLRALARWHDWGGLTSGTPEAVAAQAVLLLERRERLDAALFGALLAARPDRAGEVRRTADAWGFTQLPRMSPRHAPEAAVVSLFAPKLSPLRRDLKLADVRLDTDAISRASPLQLRCEITSMHDCVLPLWVGAALKRPGVLMIVDDSGPAVDVPAHQVITASRRLMVPDGAPPGRYALLVDLWYGPAGEPADSEWVAHLWPVEGVTVTVR